MAQFEISPISELLQDLYALAESQENVARSLEAIRTGNFIHPDGRRDELRTIVPSLEQLAIVSHFAAASPTDLSVEAGFGMGSTASVILGSRTAAGKPFRHVAFDPFGLTDRRGEVVEDYLRLAFKERFLRHRKRSDVGMAWLLDRFGPGAAGFIFIDAGHLFETVMTDFAMADLLCPVGGTIVFDDSAYPAIETVVRYVEANRPDYAVAHLAVANTTVMRKQERDARPWYDFRPFPVPQRVDWTAAE